MNVKVCKLTDGSFVVGRVGEGELVDVVDIIIQPTPDGKLGIALAAHLYPFNQEMSGIDIKLSHVISSINADENMVAQYTKVTSGIEVVQTLPAGASKGGLQLVKP